MATKWHINGDYLLACNCDYGCPCNFNAKPSQGNCQGTIGFQVEDGDHDGVSLNGCKVFLTVVWPGAIHEGDGTVAIYIDEGASDEQRNALINIVSGAAGGAPFEILAGTFSKIIDPKFVPIEVKIAGKDTEVTVGEHVRIAFEAIRNPVSGDESASKVVLPQGFIFKEGDQYSLKEYWAKDEQNIDMSHPGKCAELAKVSWPTT